MLASHLIAINGESTGHATITTNLPPPTLQPQEIFDEQTKQKRESNNMKTQLQEDLPQPAAPKLRKRRRLSATSVVVLAVVLLILLLFIIALVLALTLFKFRQPRTQLVSVVVDGVAPRVALPAVKIQLNITLDLKVLVENRNRAGFRHGAGESALFYRGMQVGEAQIYPGTVPAKGSTTLSYRLTLQAERFASDIASLIGDVMSGELEMEARSKLPGRLSFLGIYKKHVNAVSNCRFAVGIPDMSIRRQDCNFKAKL